MNIRYPIYEGVYRILTYVVPFEIRSLLKSWKTSFGNVFRTIPCHGTVMALDIRP